jgi:dihydroflavonol-4-reductase
MPDRALVTGISGFVGGHVALQLLDAGYTVRGSVRDPGKADKMRATLASHGADVARLEFVGLDLTRDEGWVEAMRDVRSLHHVASPLVLVMPRDRMELIGPAVEGTTRALEAAFASAVERVVLTASMSSIMYGHDRSRVAPFTGSDWTNLESPDINAYIESKTRAERAAWEIAERLGRTRDLIAVNPGGILGPLLDDDPGTTAALILRMLNGSVPALPKVRMIVTDVRDVAAVHVAAATAPEWGGHRLPVGNGTYTLMEIAKVLRHAFPGRARKLPRVELPDWVVRLYAPFDREIQGSLCELGYLRRTEALDAKALLGRPLVPAEDTITDTARSVIAKQLV